MITVIQSPDNVIGAGPHLVVNFDNKAERDHLTVLLRAAILYADRNPRYNDNWRRAGWRGCLIRIRERSERLWDFLWPRRSEEDAQNVAVDDAIDLINFAAFLVRGIEGETTHGGEWWSE